MHCVRGDGEAGQAGHRSPAPPAGVKRHTLEAFVHVSRHAGRLRATLDSAAQVETAVLDGCDVLEPDVPQTALDAHAVHGRYRALHAVEQDCRTLQTGRVAVRPIGVRHAPRTRAQVVVTRWAVQVVREMRRALGVAFGTTAAAKRAVTVAEAGLA